MSGSEGSLRSKDTDIGVPAARSDGLLIEPVGDETVIYDTDSKQAHCLKPLAAIVFGCCDGHATVGEIASAAQRRLGDDVGEAHVVDAVAQLESLGLLQTALVIRPGGGLLATNGRLVSRREMLRRVGFAGTAAAVGTPLVTTITAPNAFAASGIPNGCAGCAGNGDCLSGHCCRSGILRKVNCNQGCCAGSNNSCHVTSCVCSEGGGSCLQSPCGPGGSGTCVCTCSVCATGCPPCPPPSTSCCDGSDVVCLAPSLEDPVPP